ncbi:MAG: coenzyme F420-0:L-glutamate ligase / coenzyme F420:gamma-L-glutamate ligase [Actinomycetota bacterium]|nr:coenzyme F420-0:L-glutamate ligase / coenzyme F420:gamma-L-glutamate ligase [Actinomycetota bacterium]
MNPVSISPVPGIPEVERGDDIAELAIGAGADLQEGDVLVVTQKVVSKAEGRVVDATQKRDAIAAESMRVLRRSGEMTISETRHGFVCANAGVDSSNIEGDRVVLLPIDPDASARRIRSRVQHLAGVDVAVIITDTFGRAWRVGQTDVAIGVAGLSPFTDYRGSTDSQGRDLVATRICVADEIAGAAELVMGKATGICVAIVRGVAWEPTRAAATEIARSPSDDLFR